MTGLLQFPEQLVPSGFRVDPACSGATLILSQWVTGMCLQRFKLDVANAVVNTDNASLASMDTSQILDLFQPPTESSKQPAAAPVYGALLCTQHLASPHWQGPML